jgi:hypothetical protein
MRGNFAGLTNIGLATYLLTYKSGLYKGQLISEAIFLGF